MSCDISVVVVNYNTKNSTVACLKSLIKYSSGVKTEIILVDNASSDGSLAAIEKVRPKATIIRNHSNLGFGTANNQGAKIAKGRFILFLNSDTLLFENSLMKILDWMNAHKEADVVACRLVNPDNTLQYSLGHFPDLPRIVCWMGFIDDIPGIKRIFPAFHLEHPKWYQKDMPVDWATGAFLMIRKEVFEKTGGFDEKMFMYGEEVEWELRIKKLGFKIFFTPVTSVIHFGQISSNKISSSFKIISEYKGVLYILKKHYSKLSFILSRLFMRVGALLRLFIFGIIGNNKDARDTYEKTLFSV